MREASGSRLHGRQRTVGIFLQCYNEMSSGHLERFIVQNMEIADYLFVLDDGSSDGSAQFLEQYANVLVRRVWNSFDQELSNKQLLLEAIHGSGLQPDWLLWLDADEVLYCDRGRLDSEIALLEERGADGGRMGLVNLWRSEYFARRDNFFGTVSNVRLWKFDESLTFEDFNGLHGDLTPVSLRHILPIELDVVHYGFSSIDLIADKFLTYESFGQSGWPLERLVSEEGLDLVPVAEFGVRLGERFPLSSRKVAAPERMTRMQWKKIIEERRAGISYRMSVTIVCLIFRSLEWLEFVYGELLLLRKSVPRDVSVEILFVANDASPEVLNFLSRNAIPFTIAPGRTQPNEWYINSVYRAYNWGAMSVDSDYIYFVNSDMAFDSGALVEVLKHANPNFYLCTRLVELGRLKSGEHAIERDYGSSPRSFRRQAFLKYCSRVRSDSLVDGGLYMPCLVNRARFLEVGGFPEGNIRAGSLSTYIEGGSVEIAFFGEPNVAGDNAFILRAKEFGLHHNTCLSSVAYHFQEGELHYRDKGAVGSGVLIVNDFIQGINGEPVLWSLIADALRSRGIAVSTIDKVSGSRIARLSFVFPFVFHLSVRRRLAKERLKPRLVLANATYRLPLRGPWKLLSLRQDQPTGRLLPSLQRWTMNASDVVVANDADFVERYNRYNCVWLPVPLSPVFWNDCAPPPDGGADIRILFVGAFNATKGWSHVRKLIDRFPDLTFDLVSKYPDDDPQIDSEFMDRVSVHRQLDQAELLELYDRASVFVLGSPYETQCLAALEAASRGVPVVMTPTGVLGRLPDSLRLKAGEFDSDLEAALRRLLTRLDSSDSGLAPRTVVSEIGLLGSEPVELWADLLETVLIDSFMPSTSTARLAWLGEILRQGRLLLRRVRREVVRPVLRRVFSRRFIKQVLKR